MRKQILALLSALGLVGPAAPASAQGLKDGTSNTIKAESALKRAKATHENKAATLGKQHKLDKSSPTLQNQKWSKNNAESTAARTTAAHKQAQASGKRVGNGQTTSVIPPGPNVLKTRKIPPGPNTMNSNAGRADKLGNYQTGPTKTMTLNPQPLPPAAHSVPTPSGIHPNITLNPQPLPPAVHTLNPQPLPPGVHTSNTRTSSSANKTAVGSGTSGAGAGKDKLRNTSSAASGKGSKSARKLR